MYRILMSITLILIVVSLSAITQTELEQLRNNGNWLIGKGVAKTEIQADNQAIADLLSQISIQVQSSFENIATESDGNASEYCSSVLKTYSNARLDAAERNIFETNQNYIVYRYIKKADRNRIFTDREKMIKDYAQRGQTAEKELRIGDALLNYYWSLVLLRTHPDCSVIKEQFDDKNESLITYLPDRIRRIFSLLNLSIVEKRYQKDDNLTLVEIQARFSGKPVRNLDIRYYYGDNWSMPISFNDGNILLEFYSKPGGVPDPIRLNVVYNYDYKTAVNTDISKIFEEVTLPVFSESRFDLRNKEIKLTKEFTPQAEIQQPAQDKDYTSYLNIVNSISTALNQKNYTSLQSMCNAQGAVYVQKLLQYGNARPMQKDIKLTFTKDGDKTIVRGLPVQFSFPQSGRKFTEQLAIEFDADRKIASISFALSDKAAADIIGSINAKPSEKQNILHFIESYKTAYCLKDVDFVQKVFSGNALIIVGSMLQDDPTDIEGMYKKLGKNWKSTRYTKQEYIENLRRLFAANEYVNIQFEDNQITRTNNPSESVFGIQIHQYYYSQHYADEGYLFLMFDLTDTAKPKIYVRTWQPEKNPDGSIFGLKDFYINN